MTICKKKSTKNVVIQEINVGLKNVGVTIGFRVLKVLCLLGKNISLQGKVWMLISMSTMPICGNDTVTNLILSEHQSRPGFPQSNRSYACLWWHGAVTECNGVTMHVRKKRETKIKQRETETWQPLCSTCVEEVRNKWNIFSFNFL